MLHVILFILKLIGYLIVGIVALIALLLATVLLSSFCYRVRGQCDKEIKNLDVHGTFSYLFHLIAGRVDYEKEQLTWEIRVAWIRKNNRAETIDKTKQNDKMSEPESEENKVMTAMEETGTEKTKLSDTSSKIEDEVVSEKTKSKELLTEKTRPAVSETKAEQQKNPKKSSLGEKIRFKLQTMMYTIQKICDKIKSLIRKKEILMAFITEETHVSAFKKLICELKKWIKKCCPKDVRGNIHFGFEEPDLTGKVLAVFGMIYPFVGEHVNIRPDFEKSVLDGNLSVEGKFRLSSVARVAWSLVWTKNVRTTIRDLMKFSFDEGGTKNG